MYARVQTSGMAAIYMDKLHAINTFVRVVDARSFSKAAETLSLPRSSVTTTIKNLEQHLGTVLLRRSTRTLSLTEAGERYYASCRTILAEIDRAESGLREDTIAPRGKVRADMPGVIGRAVVLPNLRAFARRYPDIELVLGLSDRPADLIFDGIDCAIRTGDLADSTMIARQIGTLTWLTCASPVYLRERGEPASVDDLSMHEAVNYLSNATGRPLDWRFNVNGEPVTMTMQGRYAINETEAYLQCGIEGLGIIQLSEFVAKPYLESGRLKEVLRESRSAPVPVSIVYPNRTHSSAAVKAFVEWIAEIFPQ